MLLYHGSNIKVSNLQILKLDRCLVLVRDFFNIFAETGGTDY